MNGLDFQTQLDKLRQGKLILQQPGESGLTAYASTSLYELRSYVAALEAGYRELTERLAAYRGQAKGRTLGQVVRNQWSDGACLGYAAMAMRQAGLTPVATIGILELMETMMQEFSQAEAAEYHQSLLDGKNEAPGILVVPDDDCQADAADTEAGGDAD